jgi:hypothetical protein
MSDNDDTIDRGELAVRWKQMGPFPWLILLERIIQQAKVFKTSEQRTALLDAIRHHKEEIEERAAQDAAEFALLRVFRSAKPDEQRTLLEILIQADAGVSERQVKNFVKTLMDDRKATRPLSMM